MASKDKNNKPYKYRNTNIVGDAQQAYYSGGDIYDASFEEQQMLAKQRGSQIGKATGTAVGAAIGTALLPGVGTVAGAAIGGVAGNLAGAGIGSVVDKQKRQQEASEAQDEFNNYKLSREGAIGEDLRDNAIINYDSISSTGYQQGGKMKKKKYAFGEELKKGTYNDAITASGEAVNLIIDQQRNKKAQEAYEALQQAYGNAFKTLDLSEQNLIAYDERFMAFGGLLHASLIHSSNKKDKSGFKKPGNSKGDFYLNSGSLNFESHPMQPTKMLHFADGGNMQQEVSPEGLMEIQNGGTHENNPMGGVHVGNNNFVEEGETINKDFVFSDRIKINKDIAKEYALGSQMIGKTYAEASKKVTSKFRENDSLDKKTSERMIERLKEAQETFKQVETNKIINDVKQAHPEGFEQLMMAYGGYKKKYANGVDSLQATSYYNPYNFNQTSNTVLPQQPNNLVMGMPTTNLIDSPNGGWYIKPGDYISDTSKVWTSATSPGITTDGIINPGPEFVTPQTQQQPAPQLQQPQLQPQSNKIQPYQGLEIAGALAPMAYNLQQGLTKEDRLDPKNYMVDAPKMVKPQTLNIDPIIRENNEARNKMIDIAKESSGGSQALYLLKAEQAQINKMKANEAAHVRKDNYDDVASAQAQKENIQNRMQLDQFNSVMRKYVDDWNARSKAVRQEHLGSASLQLQQLANVYGQNRVNAMSAEELVKAGIFTNLTDAISWKATQQTKGK